MTPSNPRNASGKSKAKHCQIAVFLGSDWEIPGPTCGFWDLSRFAVQGFLPQGTPRIRKGRKASSLRIRTPPQIAPLFAVRIFPGIVRSGTIPARDVPPPPLPPICGRTAAHNSCQRIFATPVRKSPLFLASLRPVCWRRTLNAVAASAREACDDVEVHRPHCWSHTLDRCKRIANLQETWCLGFEAYRRGAWLVN